MSVRKRVWKTKAGEAKESWIVDYKDRQKNRVMRTFVLKKEAEDFATTMKSEIRDGIHIAEGSLIAMAAAVTRNTEAWGVYKGNPAKKGDVPSRELDF